MARVKRLHRVAIGVPDLASTTHFYTDLWGLHLVEQKAEASWLRTNSAVHADYVLKQNAVPGLDHIAFAVESELDLEHLIRQAEGAESKLVRSIQPGDRGERLTAILSDPDGNLIHLVVPAAKTHASAAPDFGPRKIGHVVLWARNAAAMEAFYEALGLRISDRTKMGMAFLRCNSDHHTVALVANPNKSGLQHIAFDTVTIDNVMRQMGRLRRADVPCIWGPGRHGPGNNVFTYYQDPAGSIIEFYGELEQVPIDEPGLTEKFWGPEHSGDLWGLAGPPPDVFKGLPKT